MVKQRIEQLKRLITECRSKQLDNKLFKSKEKSVQYYTTEVC